MIAGIVIAVIGIIIYMTNTEVNPVTGRKQHIAMNVDEEKAMGLQAAPRWRRRWAARSTPSRTCVPGIVAIDRTKDRRESDAKNSPYVGNYHFSLLNDPDASTPSHSPAASVFITKALYDKLSVAKPSSRAYSAMRSATSSPVTRPSSWPRPARPDAHPRLRRRRQRQRRGRKAAAVAAMVNQLTQLKFSRADESDADQLGLQFMAQAGYDPTAMLDVMKVLKEASKGGGRQPEFMQTHPLPETRLVEIKLTLHRQYPDGIPKTLTRGRSIPGRSSAS